MDQLLTGLQHYVMAGSHAMAFFFGFLVFFCMAGIASRWDVKIAWGASALAIAYMLLRVYWGFM